MEEDKKQIIKDIINRVNNVPTVSTKKKNKKDKKKVFILDKNNRRPSVFDGFKHTNKTSINKKTG